MTDLEMTKRCAELMGISWDEAQWFYKPLVDNSQAMDLVKKCHLHIGKTLRTDDDPFGKWVVSKTSTSDAVNSDLNRAICECVAKMKDK